VTIFCDQVKETAFFYDFFKANHLLQMGRSTAMAACDPDRSLGSVFATSEFPSWQVKLEKNAGELLQFASASKPLPMVGCKVSLTKEAEVLLHYFLLRLNPERLPSSRKSLIVFRWMDSG
jgi:hypothetical protein